MSEHLIDARGLSCPEPVLLTRQALKVHADGNFSVAVSSATARDNVAALLESGGFSPIVEDRGEEWLIQIPPK